MRLFFGYLKLVLLPVDRAKSWWAYLALLPSAATLVPRIRPHVFRLLDAIGTWFGYRIGTVDWSATLLLLGLLSLLLLRGDALYQQSQRALAAGEPKRRWRRVTLEMSADKHSARAYGRLDGNLSLENSGCRLYRPNSRDPLLVVWPSRDYDPSAQFQIPLAIPRPGAQGRDELMITNMNYARNDQHEGNKLELEIEISAKHSAPMRFPVTITMTDGQLACEPAQVFREDTA